MAEYSLGTAKGRIIIDYDDKGLKIAGEDFEKTERSAQRAGRGVAEAGNKIALAGGVIAAGLALGAKTAIDFEKQISAIGAVSGATREELETLRKKALQIGTDTSFSATQAALAMEELAKAGISTTDILAGAADATVALAAAGGVELPAAAELAADAMNSFQLTAKDLPKVADLIAGAANSSSISVGDFGQSLKQVGAVANLVGVDFQDTATAIALMGKVGIKGSDAGTSLKVMLSNLQPVTKQQIALFKELGLVTQNGTNRFFDQKGELKNLASVSQILQDATKNMTSQQKQLTLETIFGQDAIRAAATLTREGAAGFETMATAMGKVSAEEVAAARLDNTAGAIEKLKGSAETAAISIGTILLPAINKIVGFLEKAANWFNGLSESTKNMIVNIALLASGILVFVGIAIKIYQFVRAIQLLVAAIKAWTIWSKIAQAATAVWAAVQWVLAAAMNATFLIVLAVIAIIALLVVGIILLWKKNETFRKIVLAVWDAIKKAIAAVVDWFKTKAVPFLKAAWDKILTFFKAAWKVISFVFQAIARVVMTQVAIVMRVIRFLVPVFKAVFGLIASIIKTAFTIISAIFSVFRTVAKAIFEPVLNAIVAAFKWAWGLISDYVQFVWAIIKTVWNAIVAFLTPIWKWIVERVTWAWNTFKQVITTVLDFIRPYIEKAIEVISNVIDKVWTFITNTTSTVWNGIKTFFTGLWDGIVAIFTKARDRVVAVIDGVKAIVEKIRKFFGELKAAADKGVGPLIDFVKGIPQRILDAIGNLAKTLYNKGKDIVQGLIDGIKAMFNKLKDIAGDLVDIIGRFLPGSPAEEGPLSGKGYVLKRGQRFVQDFATGILDAAVLARRAMGTMMTGAVGNLPVNNVSAVTAATGAIAPIMVRPPTAGQTPAASRSVNIENINIAGTWDLSDPEVPRTFVAKMHEELDRYERNYR